MARTASRTDDFRAALACRPANRVPRWELEFHAFDAASGRRLMLGREFERLSKAGRDRALRENAEIILSVCEDLEFAAVTAPNYYWEQRRPGSSPPTCCRTTTPSGSSAFCARWRATRSCSWPTSGAS